MSRYFVPLTVDELADEMGKAFRQMERLGHDPVGMKPETLEEWRARGDYGILVCLSCHRPAYIEMKPSTRYGYVWGDGLDKGGCPGRIVRPFDWFLVKQNKEQR